MSADAVEEELLKSIDEVDARIQVFRKRVRALLTTAQGEGAEEARVDDVA
ncbi:MAG: hypothetical protein VX733_06500 [Candidatus Latescibacterota bacterium]|nr:hypothetical protein [Candidatus Latescibacterota bacterium]